MSYNRKSAEIVGYYDQYEYWCIDCSEKDDKTECSPIFLDSDVAEEMCPFCGNKLNGD